MDVTPRHLAERERASLQAQLAHAQKLESIGRLAGGVAHDFNNLLTVILGYGVDMQMDLQNHGVPDPRHVDEIVAAGRKAADLTRQLLAFARKQAVVPVTVDANDCIRSCEKLLGRLIGEDIRVVQNLQPGLWAVRCDPGLVGQVIINLAVNARDAMAGGGTLTLATENVTVEPGDEAPDPEMEPGAYVKITVKDTGTGMSREAVEHLFEPFFTTKGPGQGTGLGLPTVYGIVRQSKGFISVYSAPRAGTVFEIYLPRSDPDGQESGEPLLVMPRGSETVLVIEDDASVLGTVAHGLRSARVPRPHRERAGAGPGARPERDGTAAPGPGRRGDAGARRERGGAADRRAETGRAGPVHVGLHPGRPRRERPPRRGGSRPSQAIHHARAGRPGSGGPRLGRRGRDA